MLLLLLACDPATDTADSADIDPTIEILSPSGDEPVAAGDVAFSVIVENFSLVDPKHSEEGETASGYIGVSVDGDEVDRVALTQFSVALAAGEHKVAVELFYDDGDPLDERASDVVTLSVE
ncbi:MAG: hypothetical protein FJ102_13115 [Deltaproteobacteria bacterium]|nr:hypothetical protein [Deltaproteobacteria bacterium]